MDIYIVRALDDSARYRVMGKVPPSEYPPPVTRYLGANGWWATDIRLAARFPDRGQAAKARARSVLEDSDLAVEAEIVPLPSAKIPVEVDRLVDDLTKVAREDGAGVHRGRIAAVLERHLASLGRPTTTTETP